MSGKCCICGGDNGPLVGSFPEVVVKTLIQRAENVTSESCVCNPCVKEIGMTWGFRRDVNSIVELRLQTADSEDKTR